MHSLTKRAVILIICRVANLLVMLLSPILLVRIFDIRAFGQYREFMLYVTLLAGVMEFTINKSLIYFVPKYPESERQSVSHTAILMLAASSVGIVILYLCRGLILERTSYNFINPLLVFLFFSLNFDFLESYLLGKKRTDYVLLYSSARVVVRTAALVSTAYVSRSVTAVIDALIAVEAAKCIVVFVVTRKIFTWRIERALLKEQLRFVLPLGLSVGISTINNQLANLVISIKMGVERLALYSIGSQQIPILDIVTASIMDVLFPEMTQRGEAERLNLWQRANIVFCFIAFPVYTVFFFYAPAYIETLFTKHYLAAVPLFRIYLTLMLLQCFEMGSPLRAMNRNKYFIFGGIASLAANVGLIVVMFRYVGFTTPAISRVLGGLAGSVYCAGKILQFYHVGVRQLYLWKKIGAVALCAVIALPPLIISEWIDLHDVPKAISFSLLYLIIYYSAVRRFKIDEVEILREKVISKILGTLRRA